MTADDDELARLRQAHARVSRALDAARADATRQRERADTLAERADLLQRRLEAARRSLSFRLGRATRVALDEPGLLAAPRRWLNTFRGDDEILDELADLPDAATPGDGVDPEIVLAGLPVDPRPRIAGIVSERFAASCRALAPHTWRALLETEPPALVLVTAEALAPGTPWGDWGTPGGHDGAALLAELVAWCNERQLPVVYWGAAPAPHLAFTAVLPP